MMQSIDWNAVYARNRVIVSCLALGLLAGCAGSDVASRQKYQGELTRPERIVVYDFSATPDDVPADSALANLIDRRDTPQSAEEIALGRELGSRVAEKLVEDLNEMGIAAARAEDGVSPNIGDFVIKGTFVAIDEGSRVKRMLIGFGAGAAELRSVAEGYQVRETGLYPLGSAEIEAGGSKMPGILVPVGVGAAAGSAGTSAAIAGSANVIQEFGPETIESAAERSAEEISRVLGDAYQERGWL